MKLVISTYSSFGDKNLVKRGTQFKLRYIHDAKTSPQEERDLREVARVVADDARELGYYVSYSRDQYAPESRPHNQRPGHVPLSPREVALAARLNAAEQAARHMRDEMERMRRALLKVGGGVCKILGEKQHETT